jgi:hypothetical protein
LNLGSNPRDLSRSTSAKSVTQFYHLLFYLMNRWRVHSGKWESETKEDEESVKFKNKYMTVIPLRTVQKLIHVFKIPTSKELQYLSEEMVASGFRDQEEKIMIEQFKKKEYYAGALAGFQYTDVSIEQGVNIRLNSVKEK